MMGRVHDLSLGLLLTKTTNMAVSIEALECFTSVCVGVGVWSVGVMSAL